MQEGRGERERESKEMQEEGGERERKQIEQKILTINRIR